MICCARCFESLTAPVFINGKPYGYTCASIISPNVKKSTRGRFVAAQEHDYNEEIKKKVTAIYNGKKYIGWIFRGKSGWCQYDGENIYINLNSFKSK